MAKQPIVNPKPLKLTFPKRPVYKQAEAYVASKLHLERTPFRSYEWDKVRHSPFLQLVASRRVFEETERFLKVRREFAKGERVKLDEQWKDLLAKQHELRDTFEKMTSFISSNEEKRQRARARRAEDQAMTIERTLEIEALQENIAVTLKLKADIEKNVQNLKMFESYLHEVVNESTEFKNADDILSRYEALVSTRNLLAKNQEETLQELENSRSRMCKIAEESSFILLGLNNIVADLRAKYNTVTRKAFHWETIVYAIKDKMYEKVQEMNEVKQACWNIYLLMCKRKAEPPKLEEDDFEKQLVYIKKTLQELETVKKLALSTTHIVNTSRKSSTALKAESASKVVSAQTLQLGKRQT